MTSLKLHWQILIAMAIGIVIGAQGSRGFDIEFNGDIYNVGSGYNLSINRYILIYLWKLLHHLSSC